MNDDLLIKFLLKEASPEEEASVKAWISASPENQREFSRFELIWESSKQLEKARPADTEQAWNRFKARVSDGQPKEVPVRQIRPVFSWLRIAAVLFIIAGAWSFYSILNPAYKTLEAGKMVMSETLPDGSQITLNKNTILSYRKNFEGNTRNVRLENGEAFFNVSPDKSKPFVIEADDLTVKVVGTSFNVKHIPGNTEVIVETGIVQVSLGSQMIELRPGEKISLKDKNLRLQKEANTDQLYNYYRSKVFVADNTPLWRMVEVLNEAYGSNIIIGNNEIRNLPLNTTFRDEPLDEIIHIITQTFKIQAVQEDGKIILR